MRFEFFGPNKPRSGFVQLSAEPAGAQLGNMGFDTNPPLSIAGRLYFSTEIDETLFFRFLCADDYTGDVTITATVDGSDDSEYETSLVFTCQ